jgi:hypothetical protein
MQNLAGMTVPTCEVLVKGQKRKFYGKKKNKIYLHNGDEFQLKFFNPLMERIGVQLKMNGKNVDNDILILSPGQNIIVERFIGTNKKFKFSTYEIDATNKAAVKAIEKNGKLEIIFYNEKTQPVYISPYVVYPNYKNSIIWTGTTIIYGTSGGTTNINKTTDTLVTNSTTDTPIKYNFNKDYVFPNGLYQNLETPIDYSKYFNDAMTINTEKTKVKLETGRIEKGNKSNQHFIPIYFSVGEKFFEIKYKLLPFSLKPEKKNCMTQQP